MTTITLEYANPLNGGTERVVRKDGKFYINSKFKHGGSVSWFHRANVEVSRSFIEGTMRQTKAPADVVAQILAD